MLSSVAWTLLVAVVLAVTVVAIMAVRRRPERGWRAWVRENLGGAIAGAGGEGTSVLAEHRDAADGDTVPLGEILADAEHTSGYLTVPEPIEHRIEAIAAPVEQRLGALADRVAARRAAH
ncbi:hypothetical protein [Salana multivorans]